MTTKELIKKFDFEDVIEELKDEWVEENKNGWFEDGKKIGEDKGKKIGENKRNIEIAKNMKNKNYPIKEIIEITGLTIEEIEKL